MWNADVYRPDGIVAGEDLWTAICDNVKIDATPYPWVGLNNLTHGMRKGELVLWTAGTGVGKTQILREVSHHLIKRGERVGILSLEEAVRKTSMGIMSIEANQPLHLEEHDESFLRPFFDSTVGNGNVFLYDHFGSLDTETLLSRVAYMAKANGCDWVLLDHISLVVSGLGDGDERRLIDNMMTKLRSFVEETGIGLHLVSHLKRPRENDKGHEEGARVTLAHLRGSQSIAQLSDMIIALERNKQSKSKAHETTIRVLKNRFSGDEGIACKLTYNPTTGRLHEVAANEQLTPITQGEDNGDF
jgi:twinkle protein